MPNLRFSSEILDDILFRAGEKQDGTSDYEGQALIYLNRAYRAVYMGGSEFSPKFQESWYWVDETEQGSDVLEAVIKTGTVTATRGSTSITFSSAPAVSVSTYRFRADNDEDMYNISSHTAGSTAATLENPYTGTTGAGKTFRLMKFDYTLPSDAMRINSPIIFYQDGGREVHSVALKDIMRFRASGQDLSGVPESFAMGLGNSDTDFTFDRYGSDTENEKMLFEVTYKSRPNDLTNSASEEPLVPRQWRHVLSDVALFFLYTDKDDTRTELVGKQAGAVLTAMVIENRRYLAASGQPGHIFPRGQKTVRRLKTASGKLIGYF